MGDENLKPIIDLLQPLIAIVIVAVVGFMAKAVWSWISKGRMAEVKELIESKDAACTVAHSKLHERIDDTESKTRATEDRMLKLETQRDADSQGLKHLEDRMSKFEEKLEATKKELGEKIDRQSASINDWLQKLVNQAAK